MIYFDRFGRPVTVTYTLRASSDACAPHTIELSGGEEQAEAHAIAYLRAIGANAHGIMCGHGGGETWEVSTFNRHGHGPVEVRRVNGGDR